MITVQGAAAVAGQALRFADPDQRTVPALVNGRAGLIAERSGTPVSVMAFTVARGQVVAIDTCSPTRPGWARSI